jgi:hypothetical protein
VVTAKIKRLSVAFGMESRRFVHRHSANRVESHVNAVSSGQNFTSQQRRALNYFLDSLPTTTTSRTTTTTPITVQIHIPPPAHPPIHPFVWFIMFCCFLFVRYWHPPSPISVTQKSGPKHCPNRLQNISR